MLAMVVLMTGDNATGADNQQERLSSRRGPNSIPLESGYHLAGFMDAEGSLDFYM